MTPAPTPEEIKSAVQILWEIAEGKYDGDIVHLRRVAGLLERQQEALEELLGKVAA